MRWQKSQELNYEALRKQYGFDAISIMPSNMYGPGDNFSK